MLFQSSTLPIAGNKFYQPMFPANKQLLLLKLLWPQGMRLLI